MQTLTVEEAAPKLGPLIELALSGETIQIRKGNQVVELRPTIPPTPSTPVMSPKEALRLLQTEGKLTKEEVEKYMREVREERIASETRRGR